MLYLLKFNQFQNDFLVSSIFQKKTPKHFDEFMPKNLKSGRINKIIARKVASTKASRFVTRLVYMHTQNDIFLIRSPSWI